jgi:hypothetical protein
MPAACVTSCPPPRAGAGGNLRRRGPWLTALRRSPKDPLRCLPGDVLHRDGQVRRLRPLCQRRTANWCARSADDHREHEGAGGELVPVPRPRREDWDGDIVHSPDDPSSRRWAPAPPIRTTSPRPSSSARGRRRRHGHRRDRGIYSYCGVKVKIDTDRHIGHERAWCASTASRSAMSPRRNTARRCCRWAASIT